MKEINEPQLTALLRELQDREIDPYTVIKIIGEKAIWLEEDNQLKLWEES